MQKDKLKILNFSLTSFFQKVLKSRGIFNDIANFSRVKSLMANDLNKL